MCGVDGLEIRICIYVRAARPASSLVTQMLGARCCDLFPSSSCVSLSLSLPMPVPAFLEKRKKEGEEEKERRRRKRGGTGGGGGV